MTTSRRLLEGTLYRRSSASFVPSFGQLTIAGVLMFPVFALLTGVPGWLLVVTRKRTLIESASRRVVEIWDHLLYQHREERPLPAGAKVRLRLEKSQSTGGEQSRTVVLLMVEIVGEDVEIPLAVFGDRELEPAKVPEGRCPTPRSSTGSTRGAWAWCTGPATCVSIGRWRSRCSRPRRWVIPTG